MSPAPARSDGRISTPRSAIISFKPRRLGSQPDSSGRTARSPDGRNEGLDGRGSHARQRIAGEFADNPSISIDARFNQTLFLAEVRFAR